MHSNIKVGTIVNIMQVYRNYIHKINCDELRCDYYRKIDDKTELMLAEIELNKDKAKLAEFLDYYV